jgi:hypothetical protein
MAVKNRWLLASALFLSQGLLAQPYASVQLGYASADFPLGSPYNGVVDDESVTYGLDLGLGLGERWAVEIGFNEYDSFDGSGTPCSPGTSCPLVVRAIPNNDMEVYKLALVPRFNVGNLRLYGKAGYYRAEIDANIDLPGNDMDLDGLLIGAGLRLYVREPRHVSLEAARFDSNFYQLALGFGWGSRFPEETGTR